MLVFASVCQNVPRGVSFRAHPQRKNVYINGSKVSSGATVNKNKLYQLNHLFQNQMKLMALLLTHQN
jgi:hypothetical protein